MNDMEMRIQLSHLEDLKKEMRRETRTQANSLQSQITEMERMLAEMKNAVAALQEHGPAALRGVAGSHVPEQMARAATQMAEATAKLVTVAYLSDAVDM